MHLRESHQGSRYREGEDESTRQDRHDGLGQTGLPHTSPRIPYHGPRKPTRKGKVLTNAGLRRQDWHDTGHSRYDPKSRNRPVPPCERDESDTRAGAPRTEGEHVQYDPSSGWPSPSRPLKARACTCGPARSASETRRNSIHSCSWTIFATMFRRITSPASHRHPHRGIETITYVLAGTVEHGDGMGNRGPMRPATCSG